MLVRYSVGCLCTMCGDASIVTSVSCNVSALRCLSCGKFHETVMFMIFVFPSNTMLMFRTLFYNVSNLCIPNDISDIYHHNKRLLVSWRIRMIKFNVVCKDLYLNYYRLIRHSSSLCTIFFMRKYFYVFQTVWHLKRNI